MAGGYMMGIQSLVNDGHTAEKNRRPAEARRIDKMASNLSSGKRRKARALVLRVWETKPTCKLRTSVEWTRRDKPQTSRVKGNEDRNWKRGCQGWLAVTGKVPQGRWRSVGMAGRYHVEAAW